MAELDNLEEERGYDESVTFNDIFVTCWDCFWLIPIVITYYLLLRNQIKTYAWKFATIVCLSFVLRSILEAISFIAWSITLDYEETSVTFLVDIIDLAVVAINGPLLYLFFIYRLYVVYNISQSDGSAHSAFAVKKWYYIVLLILCLALFLSGAILVYSYALFNISLYNSMHIVALSIEIVLYLIIIRLFSKPLMKISVNTRTNSKYNPEKKDDTLLILVTKLNILSTLSLVTSIVIRAVEIISFTYCPDECNFTYFSYSLWPIDAFCNIFCILCSFRTGGKYYSKYCKCLHDFVLTYCVGKIVDNKIDKKLKKIVTPKLKLSLETLPSGSPDSTNTNNTKIDIDLSSTNYTEQTIE